MNYLDRADLAHAYVEENTICIRDITDKLFVNVIRNL